MERTGNELIALLKAEEIEHKVWTAADQSTVQLDPLFDYVEQQLQANQMVSGEIMISGTEPIHLTLESNLINLPLRYVNQISKIVIDDPAKEVNIYMIVEHPHVTRSGLRIELAASVQSYLDDSDSVKGKIAQFFDQELESINNYQEPKAESELAPDTAKVTKAVKKATKPKAKKELTKKSAVKKTTKGV
ncbi:hypothetical protein ACJQWY_05320 [Weissella kandleri]|uniref:hypothetical protein n=1 Tax=Weissella kandleri TaxID=1616 RepID=UPI00387EE6C2